MGKILLNGNQYAGTAASANDIVFDSTKTYKNNSLGQAVSGKINTADIIDSVSSSLTTKPLSANQGRVLNEKCVDLEKKVDELQSFEAITYKGTVATEDDLPAATTASNGDMYLVTATNRHMVCVHNELDSVYEWEDYGTADNGYYETTENKTTTLDASSTDEQYPTAKTVYDEVNSLKSENEQTANSNNLLDNPWFGTGVVNQRGKTSGSTFEEYCADRWQVTYGSGGLSWELSSSGISLTPTNTASHADIMQKVDFMTKLVGEKVTASLLTADSDTPLTVTFDFPTSYSTYTLLDENKGSTLFTCCIAPSINSVQFWRWNSKGTIKAVKLEIGEHSTLSTLSRPNVADERLRCISSTADSYDTYANKNISNGGSAILLASGSIAQNTSGGWNTVSVDISITSYKKILLYVSCHGALMNTAIYDVDDLVVLKNSSVSYSICIDTYWNENTLGHMSLNNSLTGVDITAKTVSLAFDYKVIGIK